MVRINKARTEVSGTAENRLRQQNLRPDRVFFASHADGAKELGGATWWIIDYKTSHAAGVNLSDEAERRAFLQVHREQHEGQRAAYAPVLRSLRANGSSAPELEIRAGIYYPRLQEFDFWKA
jgi:hypothetical protein